MAKMTMQQELEALQAEVARLKEQQAQQSAAAAEQSDDDVEGSENEADASGEGSIEAALGALNISGLDKNLRQQAHDLIKQLGEEYDSLSPAMVVVIFALGALFGRSLSSK